LALGTIQKRHAQSCSFKAHMIKSQVAGVLSERAARLKLCSSRARIEAAASATRASNKAGARKLCRVTWAHLIIFKVVGAIKNGFDNLQAHHIGGVVLIQISSLSGGGRRAPF